MKTMTKLDLFLIDSNMFYFFVNKPFLSCLTFFDLDYIIIIER